MKRGQMKTKTHKILINFSRETSAGWDYERRKPFDMVCDYNLPKIEFFTPMEQIEKYLKGLETIARKIERKHPTKKIYIYASGTPLLEHLLFARLKNYFAFAFPFPATTRFKIEERPTIHKRFYWKIFDPWGQEGGEEYD
jgi:hypothetical protein